jgi:hypothetical protein
MSFPLCFSRTMIIPHFTQPASMPSWSHKPRACAWSPPACLASPRLGLDVVPTVCFVCGSNRLLNSLSFFLLPFPTTTNTNTMQISNQHHLHKFFRYPMHYTHLPRRVSVRLWRRHNNHHTSDHPHGPSSTATTCTRQPQGRVPHIAPHPTPKNCSLVQGHYPG